VVLALDVGEARIGLARGEVGRPFAFGRGALERSKHAQDLSALKALMLEEGAELLIVGLPLRAQGGDSRQTERVRSFAAALVSHGMAVALVDERYSTAQAARELSASGLRRGQRQQKGRLDEGAAVAICESFLAQQRSLAEGG
jgi:putative Holliday junction resolvase